MADFTDIIQEINTNLPDNNTQSITAAKLRETLIDLTDTIEEQQGDFETEAMNTIQPALDIVENGVKFETEQLITDTRIVNNLTSGGINDVLSAEMGKQIADNLTSVTPITEYTTISPQAGGVYTYLQNKTEGDVIEQVSESVSSSWTLLKYTIDETKTYYGTLNPQINTNLANVYVYYWGDANGLLLRKEKQMSDTYANNTWTNYVLTPPSGAVTLYVMARTPYVSRYSVSDLQFINVQELKDDIEELNDIKADKSNFTFRQPLFPIEEYNTQTINQSNVVVGENIENAFTSSTNFNLKLFKVKPSTKYILSGKASTSNNSGIYVYYWADENKNYISRNLSMGGANYEWGISEEYGLISPDNAAYLYVKQVRTNSSSSTVYSNLWYYTVYEENIFDSQEQYDSMFSDNKEITFLSIGNSYSEDMFGYVPYIMKKIAPEIKMTGLMLMQSANASANPPEGVPSAHYRNFVDNNAVYFYSRWYNDRFAWRQSGGYNVSIKSALRGKTITIEGGVETEGDYIDPENRPKIDIIFLQASASSGNFKYTTGLMKQITDYLGYPVKFALFTCPYRASTSNNGNAYSYENILKGALGNLVFAKKYSELTNAAFLVSGCAAVQNARTIEALRLTGSYMEQSNNTSGYGYLSSIDGNHISDGIGRQTNAYTVVGTILKNMGMDWKGIVGDKTVMNGPTVKWINCPHTHPGTVTSNGYPNTYGTDSTTVALAQYCASMAIEHPFNIYDLSNYNEAVSYEGEDTMEFKKYLRIYKTISSSVNQTNTSDVIEEGEYINDLSVVMAHKENDAAVSGNKFSNVKVFVGDDKIDVTNDSISFSVVNEEINGITVPVQHCIIDINNVFDILEIIVETETDTLSQYTISALVSPETTPACGTVTGNGTYYEGDTVTLIATPSTGYEFINWTRDDISINGQEIKNIIISNNSTYTFEVNSNATFIANFKQI